MDHRDKDIVFVERSSAKNKPFRQSSRLFGSSVPQSITRAPPKVEIAQVFASQELSMTEPAAFALEEQWAEEVCSATLLNQYDRVNSLPLASRLLYSWRPWMPLCFKERPLSGYPTSELAPLIPPIAMYSCANRLGSFLGTLL